MGGFCRIQPLNTIYAQNDELWAPHFTRVFRSAAVGKIFQQRGPGETHKCFIKISISRENMLFICSAYFLRYERDVSNRHGFAFHHRWRLDMKYLSSGDEVEDIICGSQFMPRSAVRYENCSTFLMLFYITPIYYYTVDYLCITVNRWKIKVIYILFRYNGLLTYRAFCDMSR